MKEAYLEERGLYYKTNAFEPHRPTLVFVHGLSGSSSAWLPYEKIFENKYNLLTFDIRGHGKSKKFARHADYEIERFADDMHDLVLHLNIAKFVLISHSFGTLIALEYIKLFRETVLASVFLSPMLDLNKSFSARLLRPVLGLSHVFSIFPFHPKPGCHVDYSRHPRTTDWNIKRCYADVRNTTLRVYLSCLRQSLALEQEYFLEKIKIPTLIVHGTHDTMAPVKNAVRMSEKVENSELVLIPDTDHIIVLNNVKEVSGAIEAFLQKIL